VTSLLLILTSPGSWEALVAEISHGPYPFASEVFLLPHVFSSPLKDMRSLLQEDPKLVELLHTMFGLESKVREEVSH